MSAGWGYAGIILCEGRAQADTRALHVGGRDWGWGDSCGIRAPKCENNMKKYENNVISQFHIIFTFYSYYFQVFITFLGSGPRSGLQKSYFCHILGHNSFILFSYGCFLVDANIFDKLT